MQSIQTFRRNTSPALGLKNRLSKKAAEARRLPFSGLHSVTYMSQKAEPRLRTSDTGVWMCCISHCSSSRERKIVLTQATQTRRLSSANLCPSSNKRGWRQRRLILCSSVFVFVCQRDCIYVNVGLPMYLSNWMYLSYRES